MSRVVHNRSYPIRNLVIGGALLAVAGAFAPARADSDDYRDQRWREHQQAEQRAHEHAQAHTRARWDHDYWDRDRDTEVRVYRPPTVYYAPRPPSGIGLFFGFGR